MRRALAHLAILAATAVLAAGCLVVPPAPSTPQPGSGTRIGVFGDSVAFTLGWNAPEGLQNLATFGYGETRIGCGIGRGGWRWVGGRVEDLRACDDTFDAWRANARANRPDVAVVWAGPWDTLLRLLPGDNQWRRLGDPLYDLYLLIEMLAGTDALLSEGVDEVVWVVPPPMNIPEHPYDVSVQRATDFRRLVELTASFRPGQVTVADQWAWSGPTGEDAFIRPDGVHFSRMGAVYTWRAWLAELSLRAVGAR